jgi:hypothetical protein
MTVLFRQIAYSRESNLRYYPFWRVDLEIDGQRKWGEVQAQTAMCAEQAVCRELGVPFSPNH